MISSGPQTMTPDNLLVGDLLFFMNSLKQADHVAIYSGKKDNTHFITHAVSEPYNSVMTTRLKAVDLPYRVYRCLDLNLSYQVTHRMLSWVKVGLRFSHEKTDSIYSGFTDSRAMCNPVTGGQAQLEHIMRDFPIIFYRYIAMASHPEIPYMINDQQNEGIRCSEAIAMAFNIETLLHADAVYSTSTLNVPWVSDKIHYNVADINKRFSPHDNFWRYAERCNDPNEYEPYGVIPENAIKDGTYPCSLYAWNFNRYPSIEAFIEQYPFALPVDSKLATALALMTHMQNQPTQWQDLGELTVPVINYEHSELETQDHKSAWKQYVINLFSKRADVYTQFSNRLNESDKTLLSPDSYFTPILPRRHLRSNSNASSSSSSSSSSNSSSSSSSSSNEHLLFSDNETSIYETAQTAAFDRVKILVSPVKPKTERTSPTTIKYCGKKLMFD
jgi:hypothetical protein